MFLSYISVSVFKFFRKIKKRNTYNLKTFVKPPYDFEITRIDYYDK
jgi:hypothetical protein